MSLTLARRSWVYPSAATQNARTAATSAASRKIGHPPGEPWRNGYVESFNSRIRDECLTSTACGRWPRPAS
jgi:hypothetical protein